MKNKIKKSKKGEMVRGFDILHFVQNAPYHITGEDKCYITLNNKAYMLTARCGESRRLKKVPITTYNFLPTL